jgi:hypothetical protein
VLSAFGTPYGGVLIEACSAYLDAYDSALIARQLTVTPVIKCVT